MRAGVMRKPRYEQVCVWEGTIVGEAKIQDFEAFMLRKFGARVQYLEEIKTAPDTYERDDFHPVPGSGGRNDLFFAVHLDDLPSFSVPRLLAGIRWIEDVLSTVNYSSKIYPSRVFDYRTWDA